MTIGQTLWIVAATTLPLVGLALAHGRASYERGYAEGHSQGVWDMTPWDCGCGQMNPPMRAMCGHCGADRDVSSFRSSILKPPPSPGKEH
jgi:hypothetical protein